jgi:hypothetical protein
LNIAIIKQQKTPNIVEKMISLLRFSAQMIHIPAIPAINRQEEDSKFVELKSGNLFTYNI